MKRINLIYGGMPYSVGGVDLEELVEKIADGITSAEPRWLHVNHGEGSRREALLLLTAGVDIAIIPIPVEE
ncbi:MAG: hypothetical protein JWQ64_3275 [Subtercola sp.]|jgi:hypothetical protein|nr:hypothetical protein [Subtercola sp.]